jgi:NAD(P)-dependent dehydrogenase (short-subunit alcohol dehydrogenase family)
VLVNCAGFEGSEEDSTVEEAKLQFEVNFFGTHRMICEVMPLMREQGGGKIITRPTLRRIASGRPDSSQDLLAMTDLSRA